MVLTQKQLNKYNKTKRELKEKAIEIMNFVNENTIGRDNRYFPINIVEIDTTTDEDNIHIITETSQKYRNIIPKEWFFNDDWREDFEKKYKRDLAKHLEEQKQNCRRSRYSIGVYY